MFIVAIMTGITVANMPSFARTGEFDTEARRLVALLRMAREQALLEAREFGVEISAAGYEFVAFDPATGTWASVTARPLQARTLPEGLTLALEVEDSAISLGDPADDESGEQKVPPVLLLSSGETTPFELTIAMPAEQLSRTLVADGYSDIGWANDAP